MTAVSVMDFLERAHRRLLHLLFEYIDGGSYAEATLHRNERDLVDIAFCHRLLRNVSSLGLLIEFLREGLTMPVVLGPVGFTGFNVRRGECRAALAAE